MSGAITTQFFFVNIFFIANLICYCFFNVILLGRGAGEWDFFQVGGGGIHSLNAIMCLVCLKSLPWPCGERLLVLEFGGRYW